MSQHGENLNFFNIFRWSLDLTKTMISLEHLRRGPNQPTFLFDLKPVNTSCLTSAAAHICGKDLYCGEMHKKISELQFLWTIKGPKKDETLIYNYF